MLEERLEMLLVVVGDELHLDEVEGELAFVDGVADDERVELFCSVVRELLEELEPGYVFFRAEDGAEDSAFRREVVVERRRVHTHFPGDIADRGAGITVFTEEIDGDSDDGAARFVPIVPSRHARTVGGGGSFAFRRHVDPSLLLTRWQSRLFATFSMPLSII